jgi:hypothetical protein
VVLHRKYINVHAAFRSRPTPDSLYTYIDKHEQRQGPHSLAEMRSWFQQGYFESTLQVSPRR